MDALVAIVVVAVAAGAYVFAVSRSDARSAARRTARRTRTVSIREVKQGERVKVTGVVSALDSLMTSPIDGALCIGFRVVAIAHNRGQDRTRAPSSTIGQTTEHAACGRFTIVDDTGTARAEGPFMVGLDLEGEWSAPVTNFELLRGAGITDFSLFGAWAFSYREGLLRPGDRVSVVGRAFIEPDPAAGSLPTRTPPAAVCLRGSDDEPIVLVDAGGKRGSGGA